MNTDHSFRTVRTGPSSNTLKLMAAIGLGAVGLATVAGFTSMASAETDPQEPIVTLGEPKPGTVVDYTSPEPTESPFDPIAFEEDPDAIYWGEDGEFYCPPCGMG